MERPKPDPPLDIRPFLALIDHDMYPNRTGGIRMVGKSTTTVTLVVGPDSDEVNAVVDRFTAAMLDFEAWQGMRTTAG